MSKHRMTQTEYRNYLCNAILSAFRDIQKAETRLSAKLSKRLRERWQCKLDSARSTLAAAWKELPEVRFSSPEMTAMEFASALAKKPESIRFLESQTTFIDQD